ncbi:MAG: hypothetical protein ABI343_07450 [Burkholderiaceae bacterium]
MQLPSVDRQPGLRPAGADLPLSNGQKVVPVAPVNPPPAAAPTASVVNKIGESAAPARANAVYRSVSDPAVKGSEAATGSKDWTIQRPKSDPPEVPPPEPISKMLLEFLKSMWRASGSAVEIAQAQNAGLQVDQNNPLSQAGSLAKENLTYSPNRIKKNESI